MVIIIVSGRHGNYTGRQAKNIMFPNLPPRGYKLFMSWAVSYINRFINIFSLDLQEVINTVQNHHGRKYILYIKMGQCNVDSYIHSYILRITYNIFTKYC
mgnify:CR=1 FL=1